MSFAPGSRVGPYEVVSQLGASGMGEVHRAFDTGKKRKLARSHCRARHSPQYRHEQRSSQPLLSEIDSVLDVKHDLPGIVRRERQPPPPEQPRQLPGHAASPRSPQQDATGMRHQRLTAGDHGQPGTQVLMLHPRSASRLDAMWSRQPASNRAEQALSPIPGPRVNTRSTSVKARG